MQGSTVVKNMLVTFRLECMKRRYRPNSVVCFANSLGKIVRKNESNKVQSKIYLEWVWHACVQICV